MPSRRSRLQQACSFAVVLGACCLGFTSQAHAASDHAEIVNGKLRITGDDGGNRFWVRNSQYESGRVLVWMRSGGTLGYGDGCAPVRVVGRSRPANFRRCESGHEIVVESGNGEDEVVFSPNVTVPAAIDGQGADDKVGQGLRGTSLGDKIEGGPGADYLSGRDGNDELHGENETTDTVPGYGDDFIDGGRGADFINGGQGSGDTASYLPYDGSSVVTVKIGDGLANDGALDQDESGGRRDEVTGSTENVIGSLTGANELTGDSGNNVLVGGDFGDDLTGGGGDDTLVGLGVDFQAATFGVRDYLNGDFDISDRLAPTATSGDDYLYGDGGAGFSTDQPNPDDLYGGEGGDHIYGGPVNPRGENISDDKITGGAGVDYLFGEAGRDDVISAEQNSADRRRDIVDCGSEVDQLKFDPLDVGAHSNCELLTPVP